MKDNTLHDMLRAKYLDPLKREPTDMVGVEFEFPIVHLGGRPVDFSVIEKLTEAFRTEFAFDIAHTDDDGHIYNLQKSDNGDDLSYDCSFNTLELSFGCVSDINEIERRFREYYGFLQEFLAPYDHMLTGMGINPNYAVNERIPVKNGQYRMLFRHLHSYKNYPEKTFHDYPEFSLFSCASQVQFDVEESNVLPALNAFSALEPFTALLFANSYFADDNGSHLCSRDYFWRNSMQGYNPRSLDMYETSFETEEELLDYIASESMYCLERDGRYMNFKPIPLNDYFTRERIHAEYFDGEKYVETDFTPSPEDLEYHRSYKFEDLTWRGTVEFRSACEHPVAESLTVAAYYAGLMHRIPELSALLAQDTSLYGHGKDKVELRRITAEEGVPSFADPEALKETLRKILDLAAEGLEERGYREGRFLEPLYKRAETLRNPAMDLRDALNSGVPVDEMVKKYGTL